MAALGGDDDEELILPKLGGCLFGEEKWKERNLIEN